MKLTSLVFLAGAAACTRIDSTINEPIPPSTTTPLPAFNGAAVAADTPPPPLSGATVRIIDTGNGPFAVASDPDEDSIHVVSLGAVPALVGTIALQRGDEPNRIVGDASGRAHVVLRGGGAIATIDLASAKLLARRDVCPAPRGIDYDKSADTLYVACATGELVTLPAVGPITRSVRVGALDLRDVVVDGSNLYVSRFRSAELLTIGPDGSIVSRATPAPPDQSITQSSMDTLVAWRLIKPPAGGTLMLHQLASNDPLIVVPANTYYAETGGSIALAAVTHNAGVAQKLDINPAIDVTVDATGNPETLSVDGIIQVGSTANQGLTYLNGYTYGGAANTAEFTGIDDGHAMGVPWIIVQRRAPTSSLLMYKSLPSPSTNTTTAPTPDATVTLSQKSHVDTGFDIFHLPTNIGTACMSCHPEGGDDGHTWKFSLDTSTLITKETRMRRTQSLLGGAITNSAPYHWDGDLADLQTLCDEVFTHRMGGGQVTPQQAPILARWLNAIPNPPVRNDLAPASVANGLSVFNGSGGCATCHNGARGTLTANQDIGKTDALGSSKALQVPMLLGVGLRAPYMHDGCAATLMDRLTNPACAGTKHGNTASLSTSDLSDLETYLESL